jgi:PUA domain protein|tara:strand:- start:1306 stop:1806 length:501 start_codon:yes stop_codon:yes gene_type:complete
MVDKRLRRRTPVRLKQIRGVAEEIGNWLGEEVDLSGFLEQAHYQETDLILVDRIPLAMRIEVCDRFGWYPTLKGISAWNVERSWVAVDEGAIPFLRNGADCMGAGVHIADPSLREGDFVWIRDQETGEPIATGTAIVDGEEMMSMAKGKAISTIHWVGDDLWNLEV